VIKHEIFMDFVVAFQWLYNWNVKVKLQTIQFL